ncbi:MAG: efflux RND transporter periplasmic adaptor subunit [Chitinophagaceae bacterium]
MLTIMASCKEKQADTAPAAKKYCLSDTMKKMITLDTVQYCNISKTTKLSGQVSFDQNKVVKIFPRSSGQVIECKVSLGDKVYAGQVLAIVKSADVAGSYADLESADADITTAKRELDNAESLYKNGISSEREYTEAKDNYAKALAAKKKIQSLININGGASANASGTYVLTAPIDGFIVEKNTNAGSFIRADNAESLFTISDLKDVWVIANVFENDIAKVHVQSNVQVTTIAYPDKIYNGTVDNVSSTLDPEDKTLKVRIKLSNPDMLLKPEMFATVMVSDTTGMQSTCIPSGAIIADNGMNYVIAYNSDCDLKVMPVNIISVEDNKTFIQSTIRPGQLVVTGNELLLYQQLMGE